MKSVGSRRLPLSPLMKPISSGSDFGDAGAFRGIDKSLAEDLRWKDPIAARALRLFLSPRTMRTGAEEWCLWLADHTPLEISKSTFLSERVNLVRRHRKSDVPPWLYLRDRQPRGPYGAFPALLLPSDPFLSFGTYNPDVIVDGQVWKIESQDAVITEAMLMSRVFRVWVETVGTRRANGSILITRDAVYNTFPCPDIPRRQQKLIEDAFYDVLAAKSHIDDLSHDEHFVRKELPRVLQIEHDKLDRIIDKVFGVKPSMTDAEVAQVLLDHYRALTADDAA